MPTDWHDILGELNVSGLTSQVASHCLLQSYDDPVMVLQLDEEGSGLLSPSSEAALREALSEWAGKPVQLKLNVSAVTAETPAMRYERQQQETRQRIEQLIAQDPFVQQLQSEFGGEIVPGSIKAIDKGK